MLAFCFDNVFFVSGGVLNIFRISELELSRIGRSEHAENCKQPVVIQFLLLTNSSLCRLIKSPAL